MALNTNVPLSGQTLNVTRAPINQNFVSINTGFAVDHEEFTVPSAGDAGKHKKVTFTQQSGAQTTGATELALYTKAVSGAPQLFLRRESNGTEIDITSSLQASDGWLRLPSNILIKWGTATVTRNTLTTVTFPTGAAIPAFSAIYNVQINQTFSAGPTTSNLNTAVSAGNLTTTTFEAFARAIGLPSGSTITIQYLAIGL